MPSEITGKLDLNLNQLNIVQYHHKEAFRTNFTSEKNQVELKEWCIHSKSIILNYEKFLLQGMAL